MIRCPTLALTAILCPALSVSAQVVYPTGTTFWQTAKTQDGPTVFISDGGVLAVGMDGKVLHRWQLPHGNTFRWAEPLPNGNILGTSNNNTLLEIDLQSRLVWSFALPAPFTTIHHDFERLPNGNTVILCHEELTVPSISPTKLTDDAILEVDPSGNVVFSWRTWQHYSELKLSAQAQQLISAQGGDWAHTNSVAVIPPNAHTDPALAPGNLIVSQRYTNIVFIIDRQTGRIVWQIGPDKPLTLGQHAAHMIPQGLPGAGNILIFDNGSGTGYPLEGRSRGYSRVVEVDPLTRNIAWEYDASKSGLFPRLFWSDIVSNAMRLPNGNTFICSGVKGRLFEVSPTGEIVWEYMSPYIRRVGQNMPVWTLTLYRAFRMPANFLAP